MEVSVVIPCLNEAETLATRIGKAFRARSEQRIDGEIIVPDNGTTDGSQEIAKKLSARVVHVEARGYGNALMQGIDAARGDFVIMGDAAPPARLGRPDVFLPRAALVQIAAARCRLWTAGFP